MSLVPRQGRVAPAVALSHLQNWMVSTCWLLTRKGFFLFWKGHFWPEGKFQTTGNRKQLPSLPGWHLATCGREWRASGKQHGRVAYKICKQRNVLPEEPGRPNAFFHSEHCGGGVKGLTTATPFSTFALSPGWTGELDFLNIKPWEKYR